MPNSFNRTAFKAATASGLPPLIRVYCGLVLLELAIKERLGSPKLGHNLPAMLQKLAILYKAQAAAINQQRCDLTNKLLALHAERQDGTHGRVRPDKYPDIRYIRHKTDWNSDSSADQEIEDLRMCIDRLRFFLKTNLALSQPI